MTPEERRAAQVKTASQEADSLLAKQQLDEVSFVLVPADTAKPLQELKFRPQGKPGVDELIEYIKPLFTAKSDQVDITLLQQHATQTLTASGETPAISTETLQQVAAEANVEVFSLVHPTESNNYTGIYIYLDEVGMLKRLPLNARATQYAQIAGYNPPPQFFGDVVLARIQRFRQQRNYLNFAVGEDTAFDAPWLRQAVNDNLEYQTQMNRMTGRNDTQPAVAGTEGTKMENGYEWTQTEDELEVVVTIPSDATSKDVKVKFKPQALIVQCRDTTVSVNLFERVEVDGCTWTLDSKGDRKAIIITMEKVEQALWPRIQD